MARRSQSARGRGPGPGFYYPGRLRGIIASAGTSESATTGPARRNTGEENKARFQGASQTSTRRTRGKAVAQRRVCHTMTEW